MNMGSEVEPTSTATLIASPSANTTLPRNETTTAELSMTGISIGIGTTIVIANVFTLLCLIRHRRYIAGNGLWQQLICLCSTDILTGLSASSVTFLGSAAFLKNNLYSVICSVGTFLCILTLTLSGGNCCTISIQRYWTIRTVNDPGSIWSRRHTVLMILANLVICSISGAASATMGIVQKGFTFDKYCTIFSSNAESAYKEKFLFGPLIILTVSLIVTNITTVLSIRHLGCSLLCHVVTSVDVRAPTNRSIADIAMARNRAATITIVMVVLMLDIAILPMISYQILTHLKLIRLSDAVRQLARWSFLLNSLVNPVIYSCRMHAFRKEIWKDITSVWCSFKCLCRSA